jgi:hypothetical protein
MLRPLEPPQAVNSALAPPRWREMRRAVAGENALDPRGQRPWSILTGCPQRALGRPRRRTIQRAQHRLPPVSFHTPASVPLQWPHNEGCSHSGTPTGSDAGTGAGVGSAGASGNAEGYRSGSTSSSRIGSPIFMRTPSCWRPPGSEDRKCPGPVFHYGIQGIHCLFGENPLRFAIRGVNPRKCDG